MQRRNVAIETTNWSLIESILLGGDKISTLFLINHYLNDFIYSQWSTIFIGFFLLFILFISEIPLRQEKRVYIILHTFWHVGAAGLLYVLIHSKSKTSLVLPNNLQL